MASMLDLPEEILLKFFKFYLETEGQQKLLSRIGKVCKSWKRLCLDSDLWVQFDGTLTSYHFRRLCKTGQLRNTQELIFSRKINFQDENLSDIFRCLPDLRSVDFSNVEFITPQCMANLGEHCTKLQKIKMSESYSKYCINPKFMKQFLIFRGVSLTVLDISHTAASSMKRLLLLVSEFCVNLVELLLMDIHYQGEATFPLDAIQKGCPKLRILRTGDPICFRNHGSNKLLGFPVLGVFTHSSFNDSYFTDREMINVLSRSTELTILDIRGCNRITVDGMLSLPTTHLNSLFLSFTKLHSSERLREILAKWNECLHNVDLSRTKYRYLSDLLVNIVTTGGLPNLKSLDLNNTNVTASAVVKIIENCENLHTLNLSSCRNVGRGHMRNHCGKIALKRLLEQLPNILAD